MEYYASILTIKFHFCINAGSLPLIVAIYSSTNNLLFNFD
jgi:hypothetical protein